MSIEVPWSQCDLRKVQSDLTLIVETTGPSKATKEEYLFKVQKTKSDEKVVRVPFYYAVRHKLWTPPEFKFSDRQLFKGTLTPDQTKIINIALDYLEKQNSIIISAFTGAGKTVMGIYLSALYPGKVLIINSRKIILEQWKNSIKRFIPQAEVEVFKPKVTKRSNKKFCLVNPINIKKDPEFFKDFSFVIIDELHQMFSPERMSSLYMVSPQYILGLSATPFRYDSYHKCISLFCGSAQVHKKLNHEHKVIHIETPYRFQIQTHPGTGRINWTHILKQQALNSHRNKLICDIILKLRNRTWLVLVKLLDHINLLAEPLLQAGLRVGIFLDHQNVTAYKNYDVQNLTVVNSKGSGFFRDANVLIGTTGKLKEGFDHDKIDGLVIATDIQAYFAQALGRCMRRKDVTPVIVDLVDNLPSLQKHYAERAKIYRSSGGLISKLSVHEVNKLEDLL
jgi:superfamily II DNA or RNA helicase